MTPSPQCLTLAQMTKLARLPEDSKVIGWCRVPPGPVVRYADNRVRVVKPDGRLSSRAVPA